jgi:hypothetical protein
VWLERTLLSGGMTILAFAGERVLVRAIRKGGVEPAPHTAAGPDEPPIAPSPSERREAQVSTTVESSA